MQPWAAILEGNGGFRPPSLRESNSDNLSIGQISYSLRRSNSREDYILSTVDPRLSEHSTQG